MTSTAEQVISALDNMSREELSDVISHVLARHESLPHAKMVLIGDSGAGKSGLAQWLLQRAEPGMDAEADIDADSQLLVLLNELAAVQDRICIRLDNIHHIFQAIIASGRSDASSRERSA